MPAVESSIDWSSSLVLSCRLREIDPKTWEPGDDVAGVISANVSRDAYGSILESGSVTVQAGLDFEPREMWARVEVLAEQGGVAERWPVATLLLTPNEAEIRKGRKIIPYDGQGVLKAAFDTVLPAGYPVVAGKDGAAAAAEILQAAIPSQVRSVGSFVLSEGIVMPKGMNRLEAAWMLVDAAGWCIQVLNDGTVEVKPQPSENALILDSTTAALLGTEVNAGPGNSGNPNTYIAVDGMLTARAVLGEGRPVEVYDDAPQLVNGESLQAYAERMLASLNSVVGTRTYRRAWIPELTIFDRIGCILPEAGLDAPMRIVSQNVTLGGEFMVDETAEVMMA